MTRSACREGRRTRRKRDRKSLHPPCTGIIILDMAVSEAFVDPQLALADRCDAEGRHHDAIDALARGTSAGSVVCMTRLGKRLLAGDRAPLLAAHGARFLLDAANAGNAEAASRVAVLAALGFYHPQSWPYALSWLILSAQRGWVLAREQLRVLAAEAPAPAKRRDSPVDWCQLGARVDLASWHTSPAPRELSAVPRIHTFSHFITPAVCQWLIARAPAHLTRALVYDPAAGQNVARPTRTNSVANFGIATVEFLDILLQAKMASACGMPARNMEAPATLHYSPGEENSDHYDFVDPATPDYPQEIARNGQRMATFLIYLNEDYEGGETRFPRLGLSYKGQRGDALFFVNALSDLQPDLRMLHAGMPPTRGEKWIVSQFIRSRATLTQTA